MTMILAKKLDQLAVKTDELRQSDTLSTEVVDFISLAEEVVDALKAENLSQASRLSIVGHNLLSALEAVNV